VLVVRAEQNAIAERRVAKGKLRAPFAFAPDEFVQEETQVADESLARLGGHARDHLQEFASLAARQPRAARRAQVFDLAPEIGGALRLSRITVGEDFVARPIARRVEIHQGE
jgi:hypothetical protein